MSAPPARRVKTIPYVRGQPWQGIFAYLTRKSEGNINDKGVIHILGYGEGHSTVVELNEKSYPRHYTAWASQHRNSWICCDFNEYRVNLTTYALQTDEGSAMSSLKSWILEASNDGYSWREIDRRTNYEGLKEDGKTVTFNVRPIPEEECFRFFRISQTGVNTGGGDGFELCQMEFFGTLFWAAKERETRPREFVYQAERGGQSPAPLFLPELDGIIAHLTLECGGNVCDRGIVHAMGTCYCPSKAVDLDNSDSTGTANVKDAFICYDFVDQRVIPTGYSLMSCHDDYALRSWVVEVSNDGYSWIEVDRHINSDAFRGTDKLCHFKSSRVPRESFRFFRLRVIGKNHKGLYEFGVQAMEIFGMLSVAEKTEERQQWKRKFVYHADKEGQSPPPLFPPKLDGIIAHLTRECGGNVHDKGIVGILGIKGYGDYYRPKDAADLVTTRPFESDTVKDAWLEYDFRMCRVTPTGYSLMSGEEAYSPKSWVIEVSNDEDKWKIIDRQRDTDVLKGSFTLAHFELSSVPTRRYRYLRIRQTGRNHSGEKGMQINALEIFGTLYEEEE